MKRAVCYCRVSTQAQSKEDRYSLPQQEAATRAYCEQHGYDVVAVLTDVHSGYDLDERPKMGELRHMMRAGTVDVIVVNELDRLSRNQDHMAVLFYEAEKYNVTITNVVGPQIADDPMGKVVLSLAAFVAQQEREAFRKRSMRGKRQRALSGKPIPSYKAPYGYRYNADKTKLEIDPRTAPIVERIFTSIAQGQSLGQVIRALHDDAIPSPRTQGELDKGQAPRGYQWHRKTLWEMVRNPVYCGNYVAMRNQTGSRRERDPLTGDMRKVLTITRRADDHPETIHLEGIAPAIVSSDLMHACQERMRLNREQSARSNKNPAMTLLRGGLMVCGACGRVMSAYNVGPYGNAGYRCTRHEGIDKCCNNIGAKMIDTAVWEGVVEMLKEPAWLDTEIAHILSQDTTIDTTAALKKRLEDVKRAQANLARALEQVDTDTADILTLRLKALARDRQEAEAALAEAQETQAEKDARIFRLKRTKEHLAAMGQTLDSETPYDTKRKFLVALGVRVTVWPLGTREPRWEAVAEGNSAILPASVDASCVPHAFT